jgi:hypothetical protein
MSRPFRGPFGRHSTASEVMDLASAVAQRARYRGPVYGRARAAVSGTRGGPARYTNGARAGLRGIWQRRLPAAEPG